MKLSVCVDALYLGRDFIEAVKALGSAGIRNIELWSWWDKDVDALDALREAYGLNIVALCTKFVSMVDPSARADYLDGLRETAAVANRLGCRRVITKPLDKTGAPEPEQRAAMVETMRLAADIAREEGLTLLLEPVNSAMEAPHTFLDNSTLGFSLLGEVSRPEWKLLYDFYHMQIQEGDVLRRALANLDQIGHFHAAGSTQRHALADGELNYRYIFDKLSEAGYEGFAGLEYFPADADPLPTLLRELNDYR